jgi:hypothetical protein
VKLLTPFIISARLAPALEIGDATLSLIGTDVKASDEPGALILGQRIGATLVLDFADGTEYECSDLQSGCGGFGSVVDIFESFLSFLSAAAEARAFTQRTGITSDNDDMFPPNVMQWAADNASEIEGAQCELQDENGDVRTDLIQE